MRTLRLIAVFGCLSASLCASAQVGKSVRKVVIPSPQVVHCRSSSCSGLWNKDSFDGDAVYPAQVLTDLVNGSIVGLTAAYDKSVSIEEIRTAINNRYANWAMKEMKHVSLWRVEPEELAISLSEQPDGTKQLVYLQFGTLQSHVPSAHISSCATACTCGATPVYSNAPQR